MYLPYAKKTLISFFCVFLFSCATLSQLTTKEDKSFLWRTEAGSSTIYILGSIHGAKKEMYPLKKNIEDAFEKADTLVVEMNISQQDSAKQQRALRQLGLYTQGETLSENLSPKTYAMAQEELQKAGIPIESVDHFKPWFISLTLAGAKLQSLGFDPNYGIDKYFLDKAIGGKRILEFETFEYQMSLFDSLSERHQDLFLLYTVMDLNVLETQLKALVEGWTQGNAAALESLLSKSLIEYPELLPIYETLLYERNRNMLTYIETFLHTENTYFVVVGAGHLVGKKGIIALLREKGYVVEHL